MHLCAEHQLATDRFSPGSCGVDRMHFACQQGTLDPKLAKDLYQGTASVLRPLTCATGVHFTSQRDFFALQYRPAKIPSPKGSFCTRKIDLATAISEIKQACDDSQDGKSPFFIIAGAGVSAPSVPLASAIAQ